MKIVDANLLERFRMARRCEWCQKATPTGCDPSHLWARGLGAGGQLDVAINLNSLCRVCHRMYHDGHITRDDLLAIVAQREGLLQDQIVDAIHELRRMDRDGDAGPVLKRLERLRKLNRKGR